MELTIPRRSPPIRDVLCRDDGAPSDRTLAQRLIRRLQAEAAAQPGARLAAVAAPLIVAEARPLVALLAQDAGERFDMRPEPAWSRERMTVHAL